MPADGGGIQKGKPDGVSGTPGMDKPGQVHGHFGGGDSAGGAYPNPHRGKPSKASGFLGAGGQSETSYYGPNNPNATRSGGTLSKKQDDSKVCVTPIRPAHTVQAGKQVIEVTEDSGVAAAEATGKIGTDAPYEREQESPGGG